MTERCASNGTNNAPDRTTDPTAPLIPRGRERIPVPLDTLFDVLSNEQRRRVLSVLSRADGAVELDDLTVLLAKRSRRSVESREQIELDLHHVHLPKLVDTDFIHYESAEKRVAPTDAITAVEPFLAALSENDR